MLEIETIPMHFLSILKRTAGVALLIAREETSSISIVSSPREIQPIRKGFEKQHWKCNPGIWERMTHVILLSHNRPCQHRTTPVNLENKPIGIELQVKKDIPYLLEEKKLPPSLLEDFGIGFCSKGMFSGRVVIPIHDKAGQRIGYAGRGMKESDITKRGRWLLPKSFHKSIELFNQHRLVELKIAIEQFGIVVVEGFWSCLRLHQASIPAVALMGSELSEAQLQRLLQLTDKVWLMLDNDETGRKASEKIIPRLADRVFVRRVIYPEDQDHLQPESFTPEELQELIPM